MKKSYKSAVSGFTLIEVMIAVVIVAIIASIAVPSYRSYVLKAKRSAAKTALLSIASKQETYRMDNKTYGDLTDLGYVADTMYVDANNNILNAVAGTVYSISVAADANTFTITATPQNNQTEDTKCANFTLDELGKKDVVSATLTAKECW